MTLYEITLEQSYFGQQIINRWNCVAGSIPDGVSGAFKAIVGMGFAPDTGITAFGPDTVAGKLQPVQVADVIFVQVIAKNIYSVTDFYTYAFPPGTIGTQTGTQGLSPTSAVGFASDRTRSDIRRAQKRFVGVGENSVDSGGVLTEDASNFYQELGDAMADVNVVPAGVGSITYTPYCFGRQKYVVTESGKEAYRYWPTQSEQEAHMAIITAWTVKPQVRTQTTRQYGRGS